MKRDRLAGHEMIGEPDTDRYGILLTATIQPNIENFSRRNDPRDRERDYTGVLEALIGTDAPIVFCESSHFDSERIQEVLGRRDASRRELLSFDGSDFAPHLGKGYGELRIIRYALQHSRLLRKCDFIVKITGRYSVRNLAAILDALRSRDDADIISDYREHGRYTYSGFFIARPRFFTDYLAPLQEQVNDAEKQHLEIILHRAIRAASHDGLHAIPFPLKPIIAGYSGTWNVKIDEENYKDIQISFTKLFIIARGYGRGFVNRARTVFMACRRACLMRVTALVRSRERYQEKKRRAARR